MPKLDHLWAKTALATGDAAAPSLPSSASPSVMAGSPTRPTPLPIPCAADDDAGWGGGILLAHPDCYCCKCLLYLTCMLDLVGSRPTSFLWAPGVITHGGGGSIARGGDVIPQRAIVGHWSLDVGRGSVGRSTIRVPRLWEVPLKKII
jgi:hypothetical protein